MIARCNNRYSLLFTGFNALQASLAPVRIAYTGMLMKQELYLADNSMRTGIYAFPASFAQSGVQGDVYGRVL